MLETHETEKSSIIRNIYLVECEEILRRIIQRLIFILHQVKSKG